MGNKYTKNGLVYITWMVFINHNNVIKFLKIPFMDFPVKPSMGFHLFMFIVR